MSMIAKVQTATSVGFEGRLIEVECDTSKGLPGLQIIGLGNKAIDEARERVRSAIINSGFNFPAKRITINLAPANLPKNGADFDLPIAIALLISSKQLRPDDIAGSLFAGELSLDGQVRSIRNSISLAETARAADIPRVFLPHANASQASLIKGVEIIGVKTLKELFLHLKDERPLRKTTLQPLKSLPSPPSPTIDDIFGQDQAKRALAIAAAGHHNILFSGPPGAGKTMLAKALASLLPPLSPEEQIITTKLHNMTGHADGIITKRPFRAPHHTASRISLVGGGNPPKPGEISLAHLGVLFLDELPEYPRSSLEALRQPLEDRSISISRATHFRVRYPADFMLVATRNPCPCGYYGDSSKECSCSSTQIASYQEKLSGPLLDRIDMVINVTRVDRAQLLKRSTTPQLYYLQKKIRNAREVQSKRYGTSSTNSSLSSQQIAEAVPLSPEVGNFLLNASEKLQLTARAYFKVIKVARSIADLDGAGEVGLTHISEALQYRQS